LKTPFALPKYKTNRSYQNWGSCE